jgi:hypothetical protein
MSPAILTADLAESLADAEWVKVGPDGTASAADSALAGRVAVDAGKCLLFGSPVPPLPTGWAIAAARWVALSADALAERAAQPLPTDPTEREDAALSLLEWRMDLHAAMIAIDTALCHPPTAIDPALSAVERADLALERAAGQLLGEAAKSNLLDNWRAALVPPYSDTPPWWLA